jgi:phage host-nuclease inhibitor protein Gam
MTVCDKCETQEDNLEKFSCYELCTKCANQVTDFIVWNQRNTNN